MEVSALGCFCFATGCEHEQLGDMLRMNVGVGLGSCKPSGEQFPSQVLLRNLMKYFL